MRPAGVGPRARGFTWIELLVGIVLMGALVAFAMPTYRTYALGVNRADAIRELESRARALARCFERSADYRFEEQGSANACVALPAVNAEGTYRIEFVPGEPTADTFQLLARPLGEQARDTRCGSFTLDAGGQQGISGGTLSAAECWQGQGHPDAGAPSGSR